MAHAKPNILFLFTDQQRRDSLGCYGNPIVRTPNIDALAKSGVRFDQAYTPTSICTPARASVLTGLMPHKHKLLANFERNVGYLTELPDGTIPFSRYLREAGYRVVHEGKWHIGERRGPEEYDMEGPHFPGWGPPVQHPEYVAHLNRLGLPPFRAHSQVRGVFPNGEPGNALMGIYDGPEEGVFDVFLAERTIRRLKECAREYKETGRPFYLACNWFGPHLPYFIPRKYYDMYDPADVVLPESIKETFEGKPRVQRHYSAHWTFDSFTPDEWRKITAVSWGYVTLLDKQVGRILEALDDLGLADDTLTIFTTDHGEFLGSHRLHDKGPAMYDDTYRIPFIARLPGGRQGEADSRFVSLIDLPATFVDAATGRVPEHFDGASLLPVLRGEPTPNWRRDVIAEFHGHHFPYPQRMIRTERYKLVVNPADVNELYDLEADPWELRNLIDDPAYAGVRSELYRRLYEQLKAAGDNFRHWMSTMFDVGEKIADASLSSFQ